MTLSRRTFLAGTAAAAAASAQEPLPDGLDALLRKLESTRGRYYNVPREDGRFLTLLVKATGAKRILEVGTANGYSGIWFGLALRETKGTLTTIEIDGAKVAEAKANLRQAGVDGPVTFIHGDAHEEVRKLEGPWDFIFLDAEMGGDMDYFKAVFPKLSPGGLLLRHNAITYRNTMKEFLGMVREHPKLDSLVLSVTMEDGFSVSYRNR